MILITLRKYREYYEFAAIDPHYFSKLPVTKKAGHEASLSL